VNWAVRLNVAFWRPDICPHCFGLRTFVRGVSAFGHLSGLSEAWTFVRDVLVIGHLSAMGHECLFSSSRRLDVRMISFWPFLDEEVAEYAEFWPKLANQPPEAT